MSSFFDGKASSSRKKVSMGGVSKKSSRSERLKKARDERRAREKHRVETKRPESEFPTIFTRFPDTQVAHRESVIKPSVSERVDFEGELAVIIGKGGKNISESEAMESVIGFSCYNDVSIRDYQRHTSQFTPGKNFSKTGSFGPFLTMSSSIQNYKDRGT